MKMFGLFCYEAVNNLVVVRLNGKKAYSRAATGFD
jgi:hypothetical protein